MSSVLYSTLAVSLSVMMAVKLFGVPLHFGSRQLQESLPFRRAGDSDKGGGIIPFVLSYMEIGINHFHHPAMNHLEIQGSFLPLR